VSAAMGADKLRPIFFNGHLNSVFAHWPLVNHRARKMNRQADSVSVEWAFSTTAQPIGGQTESVNLLKTYLATMCYLHLLLSLRCVNWTRTRDWHSLGPGSGQLFLEFCI